MTIDEGYIKFESHWEPGPAPEKRAVDKLERWRRPLYEAGLIGHYEDLGVGYGNISVRLDGERFVISGTQTGHLPETSGAHYALVTDYDIASNRVSSLGPVQASSESLTHAAIYELDPRITAVVHVHSGRLWNRFLNQLPTTSPEISYGTPEMAGEFKRLFRDTDFAAMGIAVMGGHEEGILSFGDTLDEAAVRVLSLAAD